MRVFLANIELTSPAPEDTVQDFKLNGQADVQVSKAIRAANAKPIDRQNEANTLSFRVSRLHASGQEAERHVILHRAGLPKSGQVRLEAQTDTGSTAARMYIEDCVLQVSEHTYEGKSSHHTYQIIGGRVHT